MAQETKRLDALIVDVEDSTTLLKLYIGRLMKAPSRVMFYPPLVEHSSEIAEAIAALDATISGRDYLVRISGVLLGLAHQFNATHAATLDRILILQESIDLLEAQLDHMLQLEDGASPEVIESLVRLETAAGIGQERDGALALHEPAPAPSEPTIEELFEEDPFDEFALTDEFLDELVTGFDDAFDASLARTTVPAPDRIAAEPAVAAQNTIETNAVEPGPVALSEAEEQALKELFSHIASSYVGPITDFIGKLRVGPVTSGWVELCRPAIQSMVRASASMGYMHLCEVLEHLGALLDEARKTSRVVDGDTRARVFAAYQQLAEILPATFPLVAPDAGAESESIILNSLLKQIKGVGRVTIGRLFSAGLVTLEAFYVADAADLAAAAGLRPSLAANICDRFRAYREVSELAADKDIVFSRLESLVQDLRAAQFEYKKATLEEWYTHQPSRAKAKARRARQQTMWKINVALAELGELKLLNRLKDDIYDKRLERLGQYVASHSPAVQ